VVAKEDNEDDVEEKDDEDDNEEDDEEEEGDDEMSKLLDLLPGDDPLFVSTFPLSSFISAEEIGTMAEPGARYASFDRTFSHTKPNDWPSAETSATALGGDVAPLLDDDSDDTDDDDNEVSVSFNDDVDDEVVDDGNVVRVRARVRPFDSSYSFECFRRASTRADHKLELEATPKPLLEEEECGYCCCSFSFTFFSCGPTLSTSNSQATPSTSLQIIRCIIIPPLPPPMLISPLFLLLPAASSLLSTLEKKPSSSSTNPPPSTSSSMPSSSSSPNTAALASVASPPSSPNPPLSSSSRAEGYEGLRQRLSGGCFRRTWSTRNVSS
jgi:hypothetical protein